MEGFSNFSNNSTKVHCFPNWLRYFGLFCSIIRLIFGVIGIVGNNLSIFIFLKPQFRRLSINIFLSALSITDLCQQFLAVPVFASGPLTLYWCRWKFIQVVYSFSIVYLYPVVMIFHFASIWMLIAISFERWIAVCKPLFSVTYCTRFVLLGLLYKSIASILQYALSYDFINDFRKRAMLIIILIMVLSISFNMIRFWEFNLNDSYWAIAALRKNAHYKLWYAVVSYLIIMYLTPLIVMASFNIRIILELRRSFNRRKAMSRRQKENRNTAHMLLWLVCSFVCCYTPSYILNAFEAFHPHFFLTHLGFVLCDVNNVIAALNGATTFLFYLKFSSQYRRAARSILRRMLQRSHYLSEIELQRLGMILNDSPSITFSRHSTTRKISTHSRSKMLVQRAASVEQSSFSPTQRVSYYSKGNSRSMNVNKKYSMRSFREPEIYIDNDDEMNDRRPTSMKDLSSISKRRLLSNEFDYYEALV